jgi:L-threonylcarbamoyladenylate synthase
LDGRIDAVVEEVLGAGLGAGPTLHGVESTVLDPSTSPMTIYRPGAVTAEQIAEIAGPVEHFKSREPLRETPREAMPSPGVGLKHYAPRARLVLVEAPGDEPDEKLGERLAAATSVERNERVGVMLPDGIMKPQELERAQIYPWGRWDAPETLGHELYAGLRALDAAGCTVILCPLPPAEGIGTAIRDRLLKAGTEGPRD